MTNRRATVALALVAILAATSLIPLTLFVGTAHAAPQPSEGLANPSLEGAATAANGFTLTGAAETAPISRTGLQSVNLAAANGLRNADGVLGSVNLNVTTPTTFRHVREFSFFHNVPNTISATNMTHGLRLTVPGIGEVCLVHAPVPLAATSGWVRIAANATSVYGVAAASCTGPTTNRTLGDIQTDPDFVNATVTTAWARTQPSVAIWPAGRPIYVDDASLLALQSPFVRIQDSADNLCDGASFRDIKSGLECAADGATLLIAPRAYVGNLTITRPVTLCATSLGGLECETGRTDVRLEGPGGATPILIAIRASNVTLRGLTLTNANYTTVNAAGAPVEPAILTLEGDNITVSDNRLQQAASTPGPTQTRTRTLGIRVLAGADIILANNLITTMPPSLGANGACAAPPCRTEGIHVAPALSGIVIENNTIDLSGTRQAAGMTLARTDAAITRNVITLPAFTGTNVGIESTRADATLLIEDNRIQRGANEVNRPADGISGTFTNSTLRNNTFRDIGTAIRMATVGSAHNQLDLNDIANADTGIVITGDNTSLTGNIMSGVTTAIRLQGAAISTVSLRENRLGGPTTTLQLPSTVTGALIDARENNWGHYTLAAIRASINDASTGSSIDFECFIESDGIARNCPPTLDFTWGAPTSPSWRHGVNFTALVAGGSNPITQWDWTFGDGATATTKNATHPFAAVGTYTVRLDITDAGGYTRNATKSIDVVNHAPQFVPLGTPSGRENVTLKFVVTATDADNDPLTYTAISLPQGAAFNVSNRTFTWIPGFDDSGNHSATFTVNDTLAEATYTVPLVVGEGNAPPYLHHVGAKFGTEGIPLEFLVYATDVDIPANTSQRIRLAAFPALYLATFTDYQNGTGIFRWTPNEYQSGVYNLTIEANDGTLEVREHIKLTIANVNRPPVFNPIAERTVAEVSKLQFIVSATEPDGELMTFGASKLPAGATFDSSPARRLFEWTPNYDQAGYHTATFTVSDGLATSFLNVSIRVTETNRAPTILASVTHTILANRTILFQISAVDPDGHNFTVGVVEMPPNATFNNFTRIMSWRTSASDVGVHDIMFWADDGDLRGVGPRRVIVLENRGPVIALTGPTRVDVRAVATFSAVGSYDPDGGGISYQWDFDERDGFTPQATTATAQRAFTQIGHYNVTLRVRDVDGYVTFKRWPVLVDDVADLTLELLQPADATSSTVLRAKFRLSDGAVITGAPLTITAYYQPTAAGPRLFERTFTATTDGAGEAIFVIPREGRLVNFPGRHVVEATGTAATSYLGDEEVGAATLVYEYTL